MNFTQSLLLSILFLCITIKLLLTKSNRKFNLPPSPAYSFPVIGHLHLLKQPLHRTLHSISQSLGNTPIYHLRLGNRLVYVISSNSIAEECFTKNDVVLANRPELIMAKNVGYKLTNMISAPYGDHWRNLIRIAAVEIFSSHRISTFMSIRKDEIRRLITLLSKDSLHMMVIGGTDTTALTVESAISNLLNHPQVLERTRQNIDTQTESSSSSCTRRSLKEEDLVHMNHLNNVVSETLRLYPVAPLMVPHIPSSDCVIGGFNVPRDTIVLVNLCTIHRDPNVWDDPTSFRPEIFEGKDQFGHYSGKMMPFGLGRRSFPRIRLANRVVGLVLGLLIQCFEWESGSGGPVDLTEGPGLSMPMAEPLVVTCKPREFTSELLF